MVKPYNTRDDKEDNRRRRRQKEVFYHKTKLLVWDQHRVAFYHRIGGLVESWKESTGNRSTVKGGAINCVV